MRALYNSLPTTTPTITTPKLPNCHHSSPPFSSPKSLKNPIFSPKQRRRIPTRTTILTKASMEASTATDTEEAKTKAFSVLFVCLGNICRSPAAEGVFRHLVKQRGLDSKFNIDSAGTINYHEGNQADPRMRAASKRRGVEITSISRPIRPSDFKEFDLILAMDKQNREDILSAFARWSSREPLPADAAKKSWMNNHPGHVQTCKMETTLVVTKNSRVIRLSTHMVRLMCSYCKKHDETEVPDPYYGGAQGFEKVLDLLEDACESLLESILAENSHLNS